MRSLVLALVLGASALGVTATPTQASAAPPRTAWNGHHAVNHYRGQPAGGYRWHARGHYRSYRPAVPLPYGRWYRPCTGCVPAPCP